MRHKELEITDKAEIEALLAASQVLYLAMSREDEPYVLPISFGYSDNKIYIHSSRKGKKMEILRANPGVAFALARDVKLVTGETACKFSCDFASVAGQGLARFLESDEDKIRGLNVIADHYADRRYPIDRAVMAKTEVIEITVTHMTGKRKSRAGRD